MQVASPAGPEQLYEVQRFAASPLRHSRRGAGIQPPVVEMA
jgi:hypothetical protein